LGDSSNGLQKNRENSCHTGLQKLTFLSNGITEQTNEGGAFYNVQYNFFVNGGQAHQSCGTGSGGNIQVNVGVIGTQSTDYGYSYNLQLNIINCDFGQRDQVVTDQGNVWIVKCTKDILDADIDYVGEAINFKILFLSCSGDNEVNVDNGNIFYIICVGQN
jgi:hypothetical protein